MNSAIQCLTKCEAIRDYFLKFDWKSEINETNTLGLGGKIATAFAKVIEEIWSGKHSYISPRELKRIISKFAPQFSGTLTQ
jgi:ubiquitin carboxyl-terminal hydrolase 4/11